MCSWVGESAGKSNACNANSKPPDASCSVSAVHMRACTGIKKCPYLRNRSKSDPCSYELFCLASLILSYPKVVQIPPESPCIYVYWTVHHCDSWRIKDQLDVTCYFISLLMSETCWAHKKRNKIASDIKFVFYSSNIKYNLLNNMCLTCVKRKNQLDATYFIIYSILIHCSTCFGR